MFPENVFSGKNDIGRWLALIIIVFISFQVIGLIPLGIVMFFRLNDDAELDPDPENWLDFSSYGIPTLSGLALTMIPYIIGLAALLILIKPIHERTVSSLITGNSTFRWRNFYTGMVGWFFLLITYSAVVILTGLERIQIRFGFQDFFPFFLLTLLFISFQTIFEGTLFRGYLLQGFSALFRNRWIPILSSGILFGIFQYLHPEFQAIGQSVFAVKAIWFGIFLGICVVMDNGLEMALGIQLIHNLFYFTLLSQHTNAITTPAFFTIMDNNSFIDLVGLIILSVTFLLLMHQRFVWPEWNFLFAKVNTPVATEEMEYSQDLGLYGDSEEEDEN